MLKYYRSVSRLLAEASYRAIHLCVKIVVRAQAAFVYLFTRPKVSRFNYLQTQLLIEPKQITG